MPALARWGKRAAAVAAVGATGYAIDKHCCYSVGFRSLRVAATGVYLLYEYKLVWTPENSSEVHRRVAQAIVTCLNNNEGMYIKFGQQLTTMSHVLPPEYQEELRVLYDKASVYSGTEMRVVIERALGRPVDEVFPEFGDDAIASASMAQVHKARLPDGTDVAVKVQKPPIPFTVDIDFFMAYVVLNVVEYTFGIPLVWSYEYTASKYKTEVDFRLEAKNTIAAKKDFEWNQQVYIPKVYEDLSSKTVLVTEWIDNAVRIDDTEGMRAMGVDIPDMLRCALGIFSYQIFQSGAVHCDPHPGNLLVRKCSDPTRRVPFELVLLDHGLYVDLPEELRQDYAAFWCSMILSDKRRLASLTEKWGISDPDFFASMVQMRPYSASKGMNQLEKRAFKPSHEDLVKIQLKIKEKIVHILSDTAQFPKELLFVGRCLNYLRSHNWCHGSVLNRIKILGVSASKGLSVTEQVRFHLTLNFLQTLESIKVGLPSCWALLLWVMPRSVSDFLVGFGNLIDAAPDLPSDL